MSEKKIVKEILRRMLVLFPIDEKKAYFTNFTGRGFGDSPYYIACELKRRGFKCVWGLNPQEYKNLKHKEEYADSGFVLVKDKGIRGSYEQMTSMIWCSNVRNWWHLDKRQGQIYLQTWHGGFPIKKIEGQVEEKLGAWYVQMAKRDGKEADAIVANTAMNYDIMKNYFWLQEGVEILRIGSARNDIYFQKEWYDKCYNDVNSRYHLEGKCVVLYAPTFRNHNSVEYYNLDYNTISNAFEELTGKTCVILIKLHPNVVEKVNVNELSENVIDASDVAEIQTLYARSDYLISDYSSTSLEFAYYLRKASFLYTPDLDEYTYDRGFNDFFYEMPFDRAESNEALAYYIRNFNSDEFTNRMKVFREKYCIFDNGNGAKDAADWIELKADVRK